MHLEDTLSEVPRCPRPHHAVNCAMATASARYRAVFAIATSTTKLQSGSRRSPASDGDRVAAYRHPATAAGSSVPCPVPARGALEGGRSGGEPGFFLESLDAATQCPVHDCSNSVADAGDDYQQDDRVTAQLQPDQGGFRLGREVRGGEEGDCEQAAERDQSFHRRQPGMFRYGAWKRFSRNALPRTNTLESAMAAAASMGDSRIPHTGKSTPAATGMSAVL